MLLSGSRRSLTQRSIAASIGALSPKSVKRTESAVADQRIQTEAGRLLAARVRIQIKVLHSRVGDNHAVGRAAIERLMQCQCGPKASCQQGWLTQIGLRLCQRFACGAQFIAPGGIAQQRVGIIMRRVFPTRPALFPARISAVTRRSQASGEQSRCQSARIRDQLPRAQRMLCIWSPCRKVQQSAAARDQLLLQVECLVIVQGRRNALQQFDAQPLGGLGERERVFRLAESCLGDSQVTHSRHQFRMPFPVTLLQAIDRVAQQAFRLVRTSLRQSKIRSSVGEVMRQHTAAVRGVQSRRALEVTFGGGDVVLLERDVPRD